MKTIGYLRVSTHDQCLDRQIDGLRLTCDELHIERLSAANRKRPIYRRVVRSLSPGDILAVLDLDRAFRSARDALNEIDALHRRGINIRISSLNIDTTTPEGYFVYTIMSGFAEFERRMLSRRTREGLEAARRRGKQLGRPRKLSTVQLEIAHSRLQERTVSVACVALELNVAPWTLRRSLRREGFTIE